jgi:hypothetical protein
LLAQQFLDNTFWGMALLAWVRAWNCRPNRSSEPFSPEYRLTGRHPDVAQQFKHAFGSAVVSRILPKNPRCKDTDGEKQPDAAATKFKFGPSGELGYVVGNTESTNGASLIFFPNKGFHSAFPRVDIQPMHISAENVSELDMARHMTTLVISPDSITLPTRPPSSSPLIPHHPPPALPDVAIDTSAIPFSELVHSDSVTPIVMESPTPTDSTLPLQQSVPDDTPPVPEQMDVVSDEQEDQGGVSDKDPQEGQHQEGVSDQDQQEGQHQEGVSDEEDTDTSREPALIPAHSHATRNRPFTAEIHSAKRVAKGVHSSDTPTLGQAMKSEQVSDWEEAIRIELESLLNHATGTEVSRSEIPADSQILPVKVVLKLKRDSEGTATKYKARLCVLGNLVRKSVTSVFAPTANAKSLMLLLAVATAMSLPLKSIDVYGAFLYPTQKELTFIHLPPSITGSSDVYWRLNKTMYGLPSSPKAFYEHVASHLLSCGYSRCAVDPCFFWKRIAEGVLLAVVHVDDFVVAASTDELLTAFISDLELCYVVSVSNDVSHFLGIHIKETPDGARLLSQPGLLKKLFESHPTVIEVAQLPTVPMAASFNDLDQCDSPPCDPHAYMELLGGLLYVVKSRPDIAYAVNRMAMRSKEATEKDMRALLRILAYLYGTQSLGIYMTPQFTDTFVLESWCDAAYAMYHDAKSHSGYGFTSGGHEGDRCGFFYSRSCKQTNVALSSTEAELNAAVDCVKDVIWFRNLLTELGFPQTEPTVIFVDNASLITLASEYSGNHKRTKHFVVRLNFLIEQVTEGVVVCSKRSIRI